MLLYNFDEQLKLLTRILLYILRLIQLFHDCKSIDERIILLFNVNSTWSFNY